MYWRGRLWRRVLRCSDEAPWTTWGHGRTDGVVMVGVLCSWTLLASGSSPACDQGESTVILTPGPSRRARSQHHCHYKSHEGDNVADVTQSNLRR